MFFNTKQQYLAMVRVSLRRSTPREVFEFHSYFKVVMKFGVWVINMWFNTIMKTKNT